VGGRLVGGAPTQGKLSWYFDPLPTNCVADWVCPAGTGVGYPTWSRRPGPEYGYRNLAVFYQACSFNCLGCQNWHYREAAGAGECVTPAALAAQVDDRTACICYFGGDPSPQFPHSVATSVLARRRTPERILRICWETNGTMHPRWLRRAMGIAVASGGCIKFDLKAWDEGIHRALTGFSNRWTLENFRLAAELSGARAAPPVLVASTLLVPGYVDAAEVGALARFIAGLNPDIPYSLLAFSPQFYLHDLPVTSQAHAEEALAAAKAAGLTRVRIGNIHLLGEPYDLPSRMAV
jgi:pyruvate formate lyase activating enzyme